MNRKLLGVILTLIVVFALFLGLVYIGGNMLGVERLKTGERSLLRFAFVAIGLVAAFLVYAFTKENKAWAVGTREVVYMAIGAALYAVFSYLFNGTVFVVPSVSQVALRPAICIPMFFGYAFGPVVGFFTGAVGNMVGDALTGFGLYPQWSVGNGLIGLIAGMAMLFTDKKKSMDTVLVIGAVLAALATLFFFLFRNVPNTLFYDPANNIFGDQPMSMLAGLSIVVGFILVVIVRFAFGKNIDVAAAVTWGMLGNLIG
ncbi:MAG: ECF transporter S component, partial [Chloroflexi bacterium]|nr:ECF transporter S component [Chloroflexota bacterium]